MKYNTKQHIHKKNRYLARRFRPGLSMVEILIALAIAALLLTATATAFNAAFDSYKVNYNLSVVGVSTRNALFQMCGTIRSAWNAPGVDIIQVYDDGKECSLVDANGRDIIYRYNELSQQLQVNVNGTADWYVMVPNVSPIDAGEDIFTAVEPEDLSLPIDTVGKVIIRFKVTRDNTTYPVTAAAVPRNVVY